MRVGTKIDAKKEFAEENRRDDFVANYMRASSEFIQPMNKIREKQDIYKDLSREEQEKILMYERQADFLIPAIIKEYDWMERRIIQICQYPDTPEAFELLKMSKGFQIQILGESLFRCAFRHCWSAAEAINEFRFALNISPINYLRFDEDLTDPKFSKEYNYPPNPPDGTPHYIPENLPKVYLHFLQKALEIDSPETFTLLLEESYRKSIDVSPIWNIDTFHRVMYTCYKRADRISAKALIRIMMYNKDVEQTPSIERQIVDPLPAVGFEEIPSQDLDSNEMMMAPDAWMWSLFKMTILRYNDLVEGKTKRSFNSYELWIKDNDSLNHTDISKHYPQDGEIELFF